MRWFLWHDFTILHEIVQTFWDSVEGRRQVSPRYSFNGRFRNQSLSTFNQRKPFYFSTSSRPTALPAKYRIKIYLWSDQQKNNSLIKVSSHCYIFFQLFTNFPVLSRFFNSAWCYFGNDNSLRDMDNLQVALIEIIYVNLETILYSYCSVHSLGHLSWRWRCKLEVYVKLRCLFCSSIELRLDYSCPPKPPSCSVCSS
jgi:hypothetical protein